MNKDLEVALKTFLAYGKPCEGSFRYHDAWKKLEEEFKKETLRGFGGFKKGEIACLVSEVDIPKSNLITDEIE
jgi:hypothetical protein